MSMFIEIMILFPLLVLSYQLYSFSINSQEQIKQERCQKLGIAFMTVGIMALVFKSAPTAFFGLILMMTGFRLMARGLDRLDKSVFIDRHNDDNPER